MSDEGDRNYNRKTNKRKRRLGFLFVVLIFVGTWLLVYKTNIFVVKNFDYTPSVYLSDADIKKYGDINDKTFYFSLGSEAMGEKLVKHPYVKTIHVEKKFPDKLKLDIEYREELAAIKYSGLYVTIDDTLTVLKVEESIGDIFLIDGFEFKSFNIGEELKVEDLRILQRTVQLISLLKNSHIEAKPYIRYDNGIELLLNDAYRVRFGKGQDIERKFNNFVDIYEQLSEKGVQSGIIDVSHNGLPIFKPFGQ